MEIALELPEKEFLQISTKLPLINVDLFVINEDRKILLSWRDDEYCGTGWHIPGGIIRHGETVRERLQITAQRELNVIPAFDEFPCKITEIFLRQKYRNHFISLLYRGRCSKNDIDTVSEKIEPSIGDLCWFSYNPGLVYSQAPYEEFVNDYFQFSKKLGWGFR